MISKKENLLYLTGHSFIDGYLLVLPKKKVVYFGNGLEKFSGAQNDYLYNINKYIKKGQLYVENHLTLKELGYLKKKLSGVAIKPQSGIVEQLRLVKSTTELEQMRRAYEITALVFANVKQRLKKEQWTEKGLAQYIRIWGLEYGADDVSFEPIVAAGANAAIPHHRPSDRVIRSRESIVLDFGFKVNGYCSDFTRTVFLKSAPAKLVPVYEQAEEAYKKAFAQVKAAMSGEQADALARDHLQDVKLEKYFIHSLGHGTGLEVHEAPYLGPRSSDILENGMVFSIEPGVYWPKVGGVRIEDLVYLHNNRPQHFIKVPTKLKDNII